MVSTGKNWHNAKPCVTTSLLYYYVTDILSSLLSGLESTCFLFSVQATDSCHKFNICYYIGLFTTKRIFFHIVYKPI